MSQIKSLEEQLIDQEWSRLLTELKKASEIVRVALLRYQGSTATRESRHDVAKALRDAVADGTYLHFNGYDYTGTIEIPKEPILPVLPDALRPLLLSVASRDLLESLRSVPTLLAHVEDLEGRVP